MPVSPEDSTRTILNGGRKIAAQGQSPEYRMEVIVEIDRETINSIDSGEQVPVFRYLFKERIVGAVGSDGKPVWIVSSKVDFGKEGIKRLEAMRIRYDLAF